MDYRSYTLRLPASRSRGSGFQNVSGKSNRVAIDRYQTTVPPMRLLHIARALAKPDLDEIEKDCPELFDGARWSPFRTDDDIYFPILYNHFAIARHGAPYTISTRLSRLVMLLTRRSDNITFQLGCRTQWIRYLAIRVFQPRTFCLNDSGPTTEADIRKMARFLESMFPEKSEFEK